MSSMKSQLLTAAVVTAIFPLLSIATAHAQAPTFQVDATIESATVDPQTGVVTVSGTVTCSEKASVFLSVNITQPASRTQSVQGSGYQEAVLCDADGEPYSVPVIPYAGRFVPGRSFINLYAFGCGSIDCNWTSFTEPRRLTTRS